MIKRHCCDSNVCNEFLNNQIRVYRIQWWSDNYLQRKKKVSVSLCHLMTLWKSRNIKILSVLFYVFEITCIIIQNIFEFVLYFILFKLSIRFMYFWLYIVLKIYSRRHFQILDTSENYKLKNIAIATRRNQWWNIFTIILWS